MSEKKAKRFVTTSAIVLTMAAPLLSAASPLATALAEDTVATTSETTVDKLQAAAEARDLAHKEYVDATVDATLAESVKNTTVKEKEKADAMFAEADKVKSEAEKVVAEATKTIEEADKTIAEQEAIIEKAENRIENVENVKELATKKLEAAKKDKEVADKKIEDAKKVIEEQKKLAEEAKKKIEPAKKSKEEPTADIKQFEKLLKAAKEDLKEAQNQSERDKADGNVKTFETAIKQAQDKIDAADKTIKEANDAVADAKKETDKQEKIVEKESKASKEQADLISEQEKAIKDNDELIAAETKKIEDAKGEVAKVKEAKQTATDAKTEKETVLRDTATAFEDAKMSADKASDLAARADKAYEDAKNRLEKAEKDLQVKQAAVDALRAESVKDQVEGGKADKADKVDEAEKPADKPADKSVDTVETKPETKVEDKTEDTSADKATEAPKETETPKEATGTTETKPEPKADNTGTKMEDGVTLIPQKEVEVKSAVMVYRDRDHDYKVLERVQLDMDELRGLVKSAKDAGDSKASVRSILDAKADKLFESAKDEKSTILLSSGTYHVTGGRGSVSEYDGEYVLMVEVTKVAEPKMENTEKTDSKTDSKTDNKTESKDKNKNSSSTSMNTGSIFGSDKDKSKRSTSSSSSTTNTSTSTSTSSNVNNVPATGGRGPVEEMPKGQTSTDGILTNILFTTNGMSGKVDQNKLPTGTQIEGDYAKLTVTKTDGTELASIDVASDYSFSGSFNASPKEGDKLIVKYGGKVYEVTYTLNSKTPQSEAQKSTSSVQKSTPTTPSAKSSLLPSTGQRNLLGMTFAGVSLMVAGLVALFLKFRKKEEIEE